ncbi:hypothetical protein MMC30_004563 [Trapelia coarctata]|nr:hypothetical protein [Trapelia coarctata]
MKSPYYLFALLSATAAVSASSHNTQEFICNGNNDVCYGGAQTGQRVDTTIPVSAAPRRRSVLDLFRLAAEKRALKTVKDYAKAVANHALPANIVAAAKQAGWIPPAHAKRGFLERTLDERVMKPGAGGAKKGSKSVLPSHQVAAHVANGGEIPPEVVQAALAAGWKRPGPAPTGDKKAGKASGRGEGGMPRAKAAKPGMGKRDGIYAREAKLSTGQIHGLLSIMEHDPKAEQFVLNAINNDPEAESFTEHLATKWLRARELIPVEILAKRDAEALAEADPEAYLETFEERDASPEAEPEADPESYFEERDAEPESYFEERGAEPEVYFEERDAAPESHLYEDNFIY